MIKTDKTSDEEQKIEITKIRKENGEMINSTEIKRIMSAMNIHTPANQMTQVKWQIPRTKPAKPKSQK